MIWNQKDDESLDWFKSYIKKMHTYSTNKFTYPSQAIMEYK